MYEGFLKYDTLLTKIMVKGCVVSIGFMEATDFTAVLPDASNEAEYAHLS